MNVVVDTSIWSLALRRSAPVEPAIVGELRALIAERRAQLLGPIRQEVLSGIKDGRQFDRLRDHLASFPDLRLDVDDYVLAAAFFNTCRAKGIQGSNTDFLICAASASRHLTIFTTDRDFIGYAAELPIALHQPR